LVRTNEESSSKWARGTAGFVVRIGPSGVETYWRLDNDERRRGKRNCSDVLPPPPFAAPSVDWRRSGARYGVTLVKSSNAYVLLDSLERGFLNLNLRININ
jgi:hypothetical protein